MHHSQWLQNLASAEYKDKSWIVQNEQKLKSYNSQCLKNTLHDLFFLFEKSCQEFNNYSAENKKISVLSIPIDHEDSSAELLLLLGRCQLKVQENYNQLNIELVQIERFEKRVTKKTTFRAQETALGGVYWLNRREQRFHLDQIMQFCFEEIVKAWLSEQICHPTTTKKGKSFENYF